MSHPTSDPTRFKEMGGSALRFRLAQPLIPKDTGKSSSSLSLCFVRPPTDKDLRLGNLIPELLLTRPHGFKNRRIVPHRPLHTWEHTSQALIQACYPNDDTRVVCQNVGVTCCGDASDISSTTLSQRSRQRKPDKPLRNKRMHNNMLRDNDGAAIVP